MQIFTKILKNFLFPKTAYYQKHLPQKNTCRDQAQPAALRRLKTGAPAATRRLKPGAPAATGASGAWKQAHLPQNAAHFCKDGLPYDPLIWLLIRFLNEFDWLKKFLKIGTERKWTLL